MNKSDDIFKLKNQFFKNVTIGITGFDKINPCPIFKHESINNFTKLQEVFKINFPNLTKIGPDFKSLSKIGLEIPAFDSLQSSMSIISANINSILMQGEILNPTVQSIYSECLTNLPIGDSDNGIYISEELSEKIIDISTKTSSKNISENLPTPIKTKGLTIEQAFMILSLLLSVIQFLYQINSDNSETSSTIIIQSNDGISDEEYFNLIESINDLNIKLDALSSK